MKNELAIKVYEIDYSFIIKNYLDPQMWSKEWLLFEYKDMSFRIYLNGIDTRNKQIKFCVRSTYTRDGYIDHDSESFEYSLGNSNVESLKRQIRGCIERLIETMEYYCITNTKEYEKARKLEEKHRVNLREKAEDFLDEQGIYLPEIRDAYIDYYVNKMEYNYTQNVKQMYNHDLLFEVYMIYYKATNQMDKFDNLKERYSKKHLDYIDVMNDIENQMQYLESEDYNEELDDGLEDIM